MKLTNRVLLGATAVIVVHVVVMVLLVNRQLSTRLYHDAVESLTREARLVAAELSEGVDAAALARRHGGALRHRVTIVRSDGVVIGDSDFDAAGLARLQNQAGQPEIAAARATGVGVVTRWSPSRGDDEIFVAVAARSGVVRVSVSAYAFRSTVADGRRAVLFAGLIALVAALMLAWVLSRAIVRPVTELRDVARGVAAGDLSRRAPIDAPGELGELALSLGEMSVQLAAREEARRAYEAFLVQLIESLHEGVVGVDAARRIVRLNDTARALLGVREPLPCTLDLLPRDRALRDSLDTALAGRATEGVETTLDGRTVAIAARPLEAGGAVLALLDLTHMRRLEAVRRDFVANVSHELRTPLTVIGGFAETLARDDLAPPDRAKFAERIRVHARRMQRLVDDLLDLSRIESGSWVPNPESVEIAALAGEAFATVRDVAAAKGVALDTEVGPGAGTLVADATALRQVLGNLVENAVRHTSAGRVTVFALRSSPDTVELGVRDTGQGIAAEHLPRIFERFYRVDPARSREEGGTGLGLAIVRHLVEAHGGRVRAESTVGRGTTIIATFPDQG